MSAEIQRLFPAGLKNSEAERGKPRHEPPLCFVPNKSLDTKDGEDKYNKLITVELNKKTTMKVAPYIFINNESFLAYQKQHMYILDQQEEQSNWTKMYVIRKHTKLKISVKSPNLINAKEKSTRMEHIELYDRLKKRMDTVITKAFTLSQQMSAAALRIDWDDIVAKHCLTTGWLDEYNAPSNEQ